MCPYRYCNFFAMLLVSIYLLTNANAESTIPFLADEVHLGVSSCTSSTCHGSLQPWNDSNVLQNE